MRVDLAGQWPRLSFRRAALTPRIIYRIAINHSKRGGRIYVPLLAKYNLLEISSALARNFGATLKSQHMGENQCVGW